MMYKFKPFSLNLKGRLWEISSPQVMAILNITDDSFWVGSRVTTDAEIAARALAHVSAGADMLDIGACSTRPGSVPVDAAAERRRVVMAVKAVRRVLPSVPVSVDTFRAEVAEAAIEAGADIVNDIAGGDLDGRMYDVVAKMKVPYIVMHTRGTPGNMQSMTEYDDVVADVVEALSRKVEQLRLKGVCDIIVDPGLGFAKTVEQNYRLLDAVPEMTRLLDAPVLIGASRKSMITRPLGIQASEALNGTTIINTIAVDRGAAFLRVHDPAEARQVIDLMAFLSKSTKRLIDS